jgi:DNA repair protein RecN (Recombination protein N)
VIEEIRINSLGVIDESVLELGPGLNVVTGETGAGKTMVVSALGLLLGARADAGVVRSGAKAARVEGVVVLGDDPSHPVVVRAEESGGVVEDGAVVLARQLAAEGRSRAFLGGAGVPVATLAEIADHLVAVHGQSDQHRLLQARAQRAAVDGFGGPPVTALRAEFATGYDRLRAIEDELEQVVGAARERAREADALRHGLAEVDAIAPEAGEDVRLAAEETRLGFADTLRTAAETAREALSAEQESPDALGAVGAARRALESVREHDEEAARLSERVAEVGYLLNDVAADVASYASGLETDPARLATVSERRAALTGLTRKYGETVDDVLAWAAAAAPRLLELDGSETRVEELRAARTALRSELSAVAGRLSDARQDAATRLAAAVGTELAALAMPHARVEIAVTRAEDPDGLAVDGGTWRFGRNGVDQIEILLAANTGSDPRPLHKGASGGELSRVMLAIEVVLAGTSPVPTFVFDEVDAGVGGKAAVEIGRRLAALATRAQVLVVTHLPQVAAFADRHVVVSKSSDGRITTSGLEVLDDAGRVRELSRMLAGMEASETAMAHAEELLATAQESRAPRA